MSSVVNELATLLSTVRTPGDFYAAGEIELLLPRLEVSGVGLVAFPLLTSQADQLIAAAERAPYGRGTETRVDTDVRRTWQIGADRVSIEGKHWARTLQAIVGRAAEGLGVAGPVTAELYKLLVYDEGSHFVSHRDTEKARGMFATLIIALPSVHAGGELVLRHKEREVRLNLQGGDFSEVAFVAFYADCVHEVLPVTSGCRLVLVYNLLRQGKGQLPKPPDYAHEQAGVTALLQRWSAAKSVPGDETPEKLVFPLAHAYTPAEISMPTLKGEDAAAAAVLTAAAAGAHCDCHVALMTIEESGAAEQSGYSQPRRWRSDDHDGDGRGDPPFEVIEVFDTIQTLSHWGRPDGSRAALGIFPFEDDELSPSDALDDMAPDEQYFQEATGNEGASFERTYRRAALVLWPAARRLAVFNQAGPGVTLPYLEDLTARWIRLGSLRESPLWQEAHELSGHVLLTWQSTHGASHEDPSQGARLLDLMARLKDTVRLEAILGDIIASGGHGHADNEAVLHALRLLPAAQAGEWLARIVSANAAMCICSCAELLARSAGVDSWTGHLVHAGQSLVRALPGDPARALGAAGWQRQLVDVDCVVNTLSALSRVDVELANFAASHVLAWPKTYGLDAVVLLAVHRLVELMAPRLPPPVERLRSACVQHLRTRVALALEVPTDWTRAAVTTCRCRHCAELSKFLLDPRQKSWGFKAAGMDREHVENTIRREGCDLDCTTEKSGRPYSLVCTKNQANYDRRARQRAQDLQDLRRLG